MCFPEIPWPGAGRLWVNLRGFLRTWGLDGAFTRLLQINSKHGEALSATLFPKTLLLCPRRAHRNEGSKHCLLLAVNRLLGGTKS